ncbi:MAG: YceI family protein [Balneolaceae bacterium]|nr:YceI family protein [Balneolaceae bacterium]
MKYSSLLLIALLFFFCSHIDSKAQSFMADDGYVEFISTAPLLEFKGKSDHLTGFIDLDENLIDFYIDLNTIDTGIQRRNRDMRSTYLNTDKFPFAEFTGKLLTSFDADNQQKQAVKTSGIFSINGVEREIEVEGTLEPQGDALKLEASWVILLEDFEIDRPRVLFYELAEEQTVNISILLKSND